MWIGIYLVALLWLPLLELSEHLRDISGRWGWGSGGDILAEKLRTASLVDDQAIAKLLPPSFESALLADVLCSDRMVSGLLVAGSRVDTAHT